MIMRKLIILNILLLLHFTTGLNALDTSFERQSAIEFADRIEELKTEKIDFLLLDIRTYPEYEQGHLSDSSLLDFYSSDFISALNDLARNKPYLIYCRSGNRTFQTLQIMRKLGFLNVADLKDGINSWKVAGFEIVK